MYAVSVRIGRKVGAWESWTDFPTFYMLANVQGIVSESHCEHLVRAAFERSGHLPEHIEVHVVATSIHAHGELES